MVFGAVAVSLKAVVGVGLGGVIRHTAGATTALSLIVVGGLLFDQFVPGGLRRFLPATALQAAVTVHRSAGLLRHGPAIANLIFVPAAGHDDKTVTSSTPGDVDDDKTVTTTPPANATKGSPEAGNPFCLGGGGKI